ncbi:MAG: hypothetical protein Kow0092_23140 [Deferrisomatales bacterium]
MGKVVYVNFRKGKKPTGGGFGGGPRELWAVLLAVLVAELLAVAAFYPSAIGSFFFGPTVIAVAVACTLGARRVIARIQVARLHRKTFGAGKRRPPDRDDGHTGRTLH